MTLHDGQPAAYGSLRFPGRKSGPSKWAALSSDTPIDQIIAMMVTTWKLPPPRVLISVTGAAQSTIDDLSKKEQLIFRRGLLKAAQRTDAWVITGGTHSGVMKIVGQSMAEDDERSGITSKEQVVLGIAGMGSIYQHEEMLKKAGGRIFNYDRIEVGLSVPLAQAAPLSTHPTFHPCVLLAHCSHRCLCPGAHGG